MNIFLDSQITRIRILISDDMTGLNHREPALSSVKAAKTSVLGAPSNPIPLALVFFPLTAYFPMLYATDFVLHRNQPSTRTPVL